MVGTQISVSVILFQPKIEVNPTFLSFSVDCCLD